jgi:trigger factor
MRSNVTEVREVGPFERMLTVTIDADALKAGRRSAAARLSKSTKIKGFRPGKAPVQVVESVVGTEALDREAVDEALPKALAAALAESELRPIVYPRLTDIRSLESGTEVDVLITLWPKVDRLPEYRGRKVAVERPTVSDTDVDEQVERMREQFAELEEVGREGFDGDFVLVDVQTTVDGAELSEGSTKDLMYEIGSGSLFDGMDDALRGTGAGGIVEFETTLPEAMGSDAGKTARVRLLVKRVHAKRLPELTDEWVDDVSEFATIAEMREQVGAEMQRIFDHNSWARLEQQMIADLVEDLDLDLPEALVSAEMETVLHRFAHRLEQQGVTVEQYLQLTGQDAEHFTADLRSQAEANLRTRVLLESIAEHEGMEVDPAEFEQEVSALAASSGIDEGDYRAALSEGGHEVTLAGDILRRKAVDLLLTLVVATDESGAPIELPQPTDDDGRREVHEAQDDDEGPAPTEVEE